ncbi:hypothetical protein [Staphylococcus pasteuri]|uniref:hypothetical protein n=1 Tax=Staphylococcus pasteuri TaxID=45972 RepID=UPI0016039339|nr:hypothetical protein [Staphylococcus pasteuri]MCT1926672.1 hypothetical protein [Staphylococcus pasteuri]QQT10451.1 hypothetical protein I6J09_07995 [Staphylococcus pasteuri]
MSNKHTRNDLYDENGDIYESYNHMSDDDDRLDDEVGKMNEYGDDYMPPQHR